WRYMTFDPSPNEAMDRKELKRFRSVTPPEGMRNWLAPDFDDRGWKKGKAPIGVGKWTGDINAYDANGPGKTFANRSDWGDGEFLLMRSEFNLDSLDYDHIRLRVLALEGYQIHLNGHEIASYAWYQLTPTYTPIMLGPEERKHLKIGRNVLTATTVLAYWDSLPPGRRYLVDTPTLGQMDLYLEGLRNKDLFGDGKERK
nr:hypothetical protein [Akkermansiaceae bacterium]